MSIIRVNTVEIYYHMYIFSNTTQMEWNMVMIILYSVFIKSFSYQCLIAKQKKN